MELGQLLALLCQTLVLLASARHIVTTGSKACLAERILSTLFHHLLAPLQMLQLIVPPQHFCQLTWTNNLQTNRLF